MTTLDDAAAQVLRDNDLGTMIAAAPRLYPHMWSWDSAFIAVGLARLSVPRAITEMRTLLTGQWDTGMIPHIVFSDVDGYFPGPDRWQAHNAAAAPEKVRTSGICQPPVHALAVRHILDAGRRNGGADRAAAEEFAASTFTAWLRWHRWLAAERDPHGHGLVQIVHGWESGMDNSARWDGPYQGVIPGPDLEAYVRRDTAHVNDIGERPTNTEYDRYIWLIEQMRRAEYHDAAVRDTVHFLVSDVFSSAILALSSEVLAEIGEELGYQAPSAELRGIAARFRGGVGASVNPDTGMARDRDERAGTWIEAGSIAGFAPLLCGADDSGLLDWQTDLFWGKEWCGHPELRFALPPSMSPETAGFQPKRYWRGPVWPFLSWLFGWSMARRGDAASSRQIRDESLRQLAEGSFGEYYDPWNGDPLGSFQQSWTAAVALDWLAQQA